MTLAMGEQEPRALIFVRKGPGMGLGIAVGSGYCVRRGYHIATVAYNFEEAYRLVFEDNFADVLVVPDRSHLPEGWTEPTPRVEIVAEQPTEVEEGTVTPPAQRGRRVRRLRDDEG